MGKENKFNLAFGLSDGTKLEAQFTVNDGDDALEIYQSLPGNADKTMDDFQEYLKGIDGNGVKSVTLTEVMPPLPRGPFYKLAEPIATPVGWDGTTRATMTIKLKRIEGEFDMENIDEEKNIIKAFQLSSDRSAPEFQGTITKMTAVEGEPGVYTATLNFSYLPNATIDGKEYVQTLVFTGNDTKFKAFDAVTVDVPVKPEFTYVMPTFPLVESRVTEFPGFEFKSQRVEGSVKSYAGSEADRYSFVGKPAFTLVEPTVVDGKGVMVYHQSLDDTNTGKVYGSLNFIGEVITKGEMFEVDHTFKDVLFTKDEVSVKTEGSKVLVTVTGMVKDADGNYADNVPVYLDVRGDIDSAHSFKVPGKFFTHPATEGNNLSVTFEGNRCVSNDYSIDAAFSVIFGNRDDMGQSTYPVEAQYTQQFKVATADLKEEDYVISGTVTLKYEEADAAGFAEATAGLLGNDEVPFTLEPIPVTDVYSLDADSTFTKCGDFGNGAVRILNLKQFLKA